MKASVAGRLVRRVSGSQGGFTLVELLVVVTIVVALAAASVVSVAQFSGKGEEGAQATEVKNIQAAMDTMMANEGVAAVTANIGALTNGVNDFTATPAEGALATYVRTNPTVYYYCWDITGKVGQLTAAGPCPETIP